MSVDFLAIDFETASRDMASVCQVGIAKVKNGKIVETKKWFVRPPTGLTSFDQANIELHGIKPKDVMKHGITWSESVQILQGLVGEGSVVAHNSRFDKGVFESACARSNIEIPQWNWLDTLTISRLYLDLPNYRLPTVSKHLKVTPFSHHDAEDDAQACAEIVIKLADLVETKDLEQLWQMKGVKNSRNQWFDKASKAKVSELPSPSQDANPLHPLNSHHVVITGSIEGMTRWEVFEAIAKEGGQPQKGVTRKTSMLVVCEGLALTDDEIAKTGKGRKALEYRDRGQDIKFISGVQFNELLSWTDSSQSPENNFSTIESEPLNQAHKNHSSKAPEEAPLSPHTNLLGENSKKSSLLSPLPEKISAPKETSSVPNSNSPHPLSLVQENTHADQLNTSNSKKYSAKNLSSAPSPEIQVESPSNDYYPSKSSLRRKIWGWILIIPSALLSLLYVLFLGIGLAMDPPSLGILIGILFVSVILLLIPAALIYFGLKLIRHNRSNFQQINR